MRSVKFFLAALFLAGGFTLVVGPAGGQTVITKAKLGDQEYCNMKFPPISEETLNSDRRVLEDARSSDLIDYYGPCSFDPAGKEAAQQQRPQKRDKERWG